MIKRFQQKYHALGSDTVITLVAEADGVDVEAIFAELHDRITTFELQFSRFLDDSELTLFNRRAGEKADVSEKFRELLVTARTMSQQTEGLYNPFVLPALQKSGYVGSWPSPQQGTLATDFTTRQVVTIDKLIIGDGWASISANSALDFGGIGKGYLLDQLAAILMNEELEGYWLSLGGDIICAGYDLEYQLWVIAIQDASRAAAIIDTIQNNDGKVLAIATSGIIKRRGTHDGRPWHHIIDPRTGESSSTGILTVTVCAAQAVIADVYAKCIVIAGADQAISYQKNKIISSYIIQPDEQKTLVTKEMK